MGTIMTSHLHYHPYTAPTRAEGEQKDCLLDQYHDERFSRAYAKCFVRVSDHRHLPDEARDAVLLQFWRTHTHDIAPAVQGFIKISDTNYRVTLRYEWAGRVFRPEYDYILHDSGHYGVYHIARYHDGKPCYGGFCPDCGW
jgi:hypothetical protein